MSRLSLFPLDSLTVKFHRIRCSSGAESSQHHRNDGRLGHFTPYVRGCVDSLALYIQARRSFSQLRSNKVSKLISLSHTDKVTLFITLVFVCGFISSTCARYPLHDPEYLSIPGVSEVPSPDEPNSLDDPTWSPFGRQIACIGYKLGEPKDIYIVDIHNDEWFLLTPGEFFVSALSWSSDGKKVAFSGTKLEKARVEYQWTSREGLWIADIEIREASLLLGEELIGGSVFDIDWLPNSEELAIAVLDRLSGKFLVKLVSVDTLETIVILDGLDKELRIQDIEWSPLGEWLAIVLIGDKPLLLLSRDGSEVKSIPIAVKIKETLNRAGRFSLTQEDVSWYPGGHWMAMSVGGRREDDTVILFPANGECVIPLDPMIFGKPLRMDLSPDGRTIVLSNHTGRGLYTIELETAFGPEVLQDHLMCP